MAKLENNRTKAGTTNPSLPEGEMTVFSLFVAPHLFAPPKPQKPQKPQKPIEFSAKEMYTHLNRDFEV